MSGKALKRLVRWVSESWMMFAFFACFFLFWEWSIDWFEVPQYILNKPSEIITNSAADLPRLMQYTISLAWKLFWDLWWPSVWRFPLESRLLFRISFAKRCIHSSSALKWSLRLLLPPYSFPGWALACSQKSLLSFWYVSSRLF